MINGMDHVAIAVKDMGEAVDMLSRVFGIAPTHTEDIADYDVQVATFTLGATCIELVAGTSESSPISKFVEKRGPGIHHIALEVDDIVAEISAMKENGVQMIDETPRGGKENSLVAFIHPASTGKILYELVQNQKQKD